MIKSAAASAPPLREEWLTPDSVSEDVMRSRSLRTRIERIEARVAATALEKETQTRAPRDITNSMATGKEPRGYRYRHSSNDWVWEFITKQLRYLDHEETRDFYRDMMRRDDLQNDDKALLACNDRFFLLTELLGRTDMHHPWIFTRCREVEAEPDGCIDLWARAHGKTTIITVAGTLQEIFCNPEITIAIFSATKPLAQEILGQIKNEFETNECLKEIFKDVLYENPRGKGPDGRPAKWSLQRGITVKRKGKPKEATIEAHGLIDGQPTGQHFKMHVYDDIVTQDYLSDELLKKTTERFELADNLGTRHGVRKWIAGTRYSFADTYGVILDKKAAKPRIYPATEDGTLNGRPILLTPENWARIKRDQGTKIVSAQMLLNPLAGSEQTFRPQWLLTYDVLPSLLNVYILVDPSKGKGVRSDRTAIAVIGIDQGGTKYLLDGYCHRMKLSQRWEAIKALKRKWESHPGVQMVRVGYEQYGMLDDISVMQQMMLAERNVFEIVELKTPETGGHSKRDRIERLEPDIRAGRFRFPVAVHNPDGGGSCYWSVCTESADKASNDGIKAKYNIGQILFRPAETLTKKMLEMERTGERHRIVQAIQRRDENGGIYDLTRIFIHELARHPFADHDDLIDAASRIYDINPCPPELYHWQSTESLEMEIDELGPEA
jgi:hypothetical protein